MNIFQFMPIPALFEILSLYASGVQTSILRPRSTNYRWWRVQKLSFCTRNRFIQTRKMDRTITESLNIVQRYKFHPVAFGHRITFVLRSKNNSLCHPDELSADVIEIPHYPFMTR